MSISTNRIWTELHNVTTFDLLPFTKGVYQRNLIKGTENLSGSTLRGKARLFKARYHKSQTNLLKRIQQAGFHVGERRAKHNARILIIKGTENDSQ